MPIQKARDILNNAGADKKAVNECIDSLRRESQYVRYAVKMKYRSDSSGQTVLEEIEELIEELKKKL
jgi:hypothetical protein